MTDTFRQGERLTAAKLNNLLARPVSITQVTGLEDTLELKASVEALNAAVTDLEGQIAEVEASVGGGTVTSVAVSGGSTGLTTSGGPITAAGTITLAGTLAVANGGTGATDAATARSNLGLAAAATRAIVVSGSAVMTASEKLARVPAPFNFTVAAGTYTYANAAGTAATGSTTVSVKKNGTEVATAAFAASGTTLTVTVASTATFTLGSDAVTFVGPATPDATLADWSIVLPIVLT